MIGLTRQRSGFVLFYGDILTGARAFLDFYEYNTKIIYLITLPA